MIKLSEVAKMLNQSWQAVDCELDGFNTDSRAIQPRELFIALKGERFNGHDYVLQAEQQGARAIIASEPVKTTLPVLQVADTTAALLQLGAAWRLRFDPAVVAITGSCGKTSTRSLVQGILSTVGPTLASERSFNNNIGVPLTLLKLQAEHRYAVLEVGANHHGEILPLVQAVQPKVAMITNAGSSHLAGFGSVEGVARAKSEIYATLAVDGVAVINQDDAFAASWRQGIQQAQVITFGINNQADVMATDIDFNANSHAVFTLRTPLGDVKIELQLMGHHNVYNAAAAAAVAVALNIPLTHIQQGLQAIEPEKQRLVEQKGPACATVIDDSYNANPTSVKAAIEVLAQRSGVRVLVLGDMLELGEWSERLHHEIGVTARMIGLDYVFCYGAYSRITAGAFGENGRHFATKEDLVQALYPLMSEKTTVLIKGSNSMGMHQVTQSLLGGETGVGREAQ